MAMELISKLVKNSFEEETIPNDFNTDDFIMKFVFNTIKCLNKYLEEKDPTTYGGLPTNYLQDRRKMYVLGIPLFNPDTWYKEHERLCRPTKPGKWRGPMGQIALDDDPKYHLWEELWESPTFDIFFWVGLDAIWKLPENLPNPLIKLENVVQQYIFEKNWSIRAELYDLGFIEPLFIILFGGGIGEYEFNVVETGCVRETLLQIECVYFEVFGDKKEELCHFLRELGCSDQSTNKYWNLILALSRVFSTHMIA